MKIYAVQMQVEPGRPDLNLETMRAAIARAKTHHADLVVFPEMALPGCLIGDLWEESSFIDWCETCGNEIATLAQGIDILFGNVARDSELNESGRPILYNAAFYAADGRFKTLVQTQLVQKNFLPKIFLSGNRNSDEHRYFSDLKQLAQKNNLSLEEILQPYKLKNGAQIGISICSGTVTLNSALTSREKPLKILASKMKRGDILVHMACAPFIMGKNSLQNQILSQEAANANQSILYLNAVGTQNNGKNIYAFEGGSKIYNSRGENILSFPTFESFETLLDWGENVSALNDSDTKINEAAPQNAEIKEVHKALVYMIRENLKRFHIERVVIGASGGIDSAVSAALYAEAIGASNVFLVNMPTRFNSATTRNAAKELADRLGCPYLVAPISSVVDSVLDSLNGLQFARHEMPLQIDGIHYENLQARTRSGAFLATIASVLGAAFTCNGNKSEATVGYCTLYGDTAGIFCVLGDLWKTQVYALAKEINAVQQIIPQTSIDIPASAELSEAQNVDEGKGDPIIYAYHDKLFAFWVEHANGLMDSEKALADGTLCDKLQIEPAFFRQIFKSEKEALADMRHWYKRYKGIALAKRLQMPPILSVSRRAFGLDYREVQL